MRKRLTRGHASNGRRLLEDVDVHLTWMGLTDLRGGYSLGPYARRPRSLMTYSQDPPRYSNPRSVFPEHGFR